VTRELGVGLLAGVASGALALVLALGARAALPGRDHPPPLGGPALLVAVAVGFGATEGLPGLLLAGLVLAMLAGALAEVLGWSAAVAAPLAVPAALLVVFAAPAGTRVWAAVLAGAGVVVVGGLLAGLDRRWRDRGLGPPLVAITAGGVFLTVPDTEHAVVLAGATAVLALLGWPVPLVSLGVPGAFVASGGVSWVALQGGVGRPASVVGALACWGLVLLEPLDRDRRPGSVLWAMALDLVVVVAVARVAGPRTSPVVAAVLAAGLLTAGAVARRPPATRRD
jgi:hypothetical protein